MSNIVRELYPGEWTRFYRVFSFSLYWPKVEKADVTGLRLAAIKSVNQADVMVSVGIDQLEHLRTLKLKLFRAENPDQVIHQVFFFYLSVFFVMIFILFHL